MSMPLPLSRSSAIFLASDIVSPTPTRDASRDFAQNSGLLGVGSNTTRIKIAQYLFRRQGMLVVLIARFVAVLRSVVGFIAGANRMPFAKFMIANSAGR